jgi:HD superfamily phosphohydrolase
VLADVHNTVVRDNIEHNRLITASEKIRDIVDSREFQRLRHIRQMGLSSYVFPTAEHSRFSHSLGVYATAKQAFEHLRRRAIPFDFQTHGVKFDDDLEMEFTIAALCHDIGHSPFSHVLETVLLPDDLRTHEECTQAMLGDARSDIAQKVNAITDLQSVLYFLDRSHQNRALADLISSTFDVDRCDYVLRDSLMAGVEYGKFDLKWLLHAMSIETDVLNQPVLLLDGPRGLDALRQFLSARRYLHRQVYFHPTIRAAQILLKAIFARIQDLPPSKKTSDLTPKSLRPIVRHKKLSLGQFIETTDAEVHMMIKSFAEHPHPDAVLSFLADAFVKRKLPKCILDSARSNSAISKKYRINDSMEGSDQPGFETFSRVVENLTVFVGDLMVRQNLPPGVSPYLVAYDPINFDSTPPADLLFSFGKDIVTFPEIDGRCVGFDARSLLDSFVIHRLFVPRGFETPAQEHLQEKYGIMPRESGGANA